MANSLIGNSAVATHMYQAFYGQAPSNALYNAYLAEITASGQAGFAATLAGNFSHTSDAALALQVLNNLGVTATTVTATGEYTTLLAQLTLAFTAFPTMRGQIILNATNLFANLESDATYGAAATAYNNQALANFTYSSNTANTAAGTPSSTQTYVLTTGTDILTGTAANDTFSATVATLNSLDVLDGAGGTNTLTITDTAAISSQPATLANVQVLKATSTTSTVGNAATTATIAAKQSETFDFAATGKSVGLGPVVVTVGGVSLTVTPAASAGAGAATTTELAAAINTVLNNAYATSATYASGASAVVTVTANVAGTALPSISFTAGTGNTTLVAPSATAVQANQVAAAAVAASTFASAATVDTQITAAGNVYASAAATATAEVTAGGAATFSGGTTVTIGAADSVKDTGAKGAVVITVSAAPTTSIDAVSTTGWAAGAGVYVTGGTTVSVTETAGKSTSNAAATGNAKAIQIGADPALATGALTNGASTGAIAPAITGNAQTIGNLSSAPTGNVTTSVLTAYTDVSGLKDVTYGSGIEKVFMNGGTTASITGATTVTVRDMQTVLTLATPTATAAPGTSHLTTVNLTGLTGTANLYTDALTNLSVVDGKTAAAVIVNSNTGANTGALNLSVGNATVTVTDTAATSVALTGVASAFTAVNGTANGTNSASTLTLATAAAKTLTVAGTSNITLGASTLDALTTVTDTASGKLDLGTASNYLKLTTINASGASGAVTATIGSTQSFVGGSGNDKVTISAIPLFTVDGGTGTNEIVIGAAAALTGLSTSVANFSVLGIGAYSGMSTATALGFSTFAVEGTNAVTIGSTAGVTGTSATITDAATASGLITLSKFALDNLSLTVNLGADNAAAASASQGNLQLATTSAAALAGDGVASITINSAGVTNAQQAINVSLTGFNTLTYAAADTLETIVVLGDSDLTLAIGATAVHNAAVTSLDASAFTGDLTVSGSTTFAVTGATIKGGAGSLTVTGTAAADTITVGTGGGAITGSGGADSITIATGATGITTLVYADSVSVLAAVDLVNGFTNFATKTTAGDLSDVLNLSGAAAVVANTSTGSVTQALGTIYYTATNGVMNFFTSTGAANPVTSATALIAAVEAVVNADASTAGGNGATAAFELAGNTYVVHAATASQSLTTDTVVELVGVTGVTALSASTAGLHTVLIA